MEAQLEHSIKKIGLSGEEKELLRSGLTSGKFSHKAERVCQMLR